MIVGIPKEVKDNENRVSTTPSGVHEYVARGNTVLVETNAGAGSGFSDSEYSAAGAEIVVTVPPPIAATPASESIPLTILYEDADIVVVDKPAGMVVHPAAGHFGGTLVNALLHHVQGLSGIGGEQRPGIVHRLDKDTSGLLVIAKTLTAQTDLVRQLQARTVTREYRAVVHGRIARDGKMEGAIGRDPRSRTRMAVVHSGKPALTHYKVLEKLARASVLACRLETGRTHQIRVHLQKLGHPIWGDPVYGPRNPPATPQLPRQALHAEKLALTHPQSGETLQWQAPLPADMRQLIAALRDE